VSAGYDGSAANRESFQPAVSADGRIVVFASLADNLVASDTNGAADVFTYDRDTLSLTRISVDTGGGQFGAASTTPAISPDALRIAVATSASNLGGASNASLVALTPSALDVNRWLPGLIPVTPLSTLVDGRHPMLSNGGSLLVFHSQASDLVTGDTNERDDFFTFRPSTGVLERLVTANDAPGFVIDDCRPRLSANGSVLVFCGHQGTAPKNVSVIHLDTKQSEWAGISTEGLPSKSSCHSPALSADGDIVAMICDGDDLVPGDKNGLPDVFVRDLANHVTTRVSLFDDGSESPLASFSVGISGNGRWVVTQWGNVEGTTSERTFGGVSFYDRKCGVARTLFIATGTTVGTIGSESRIEDIALSHDGRTLVGTVTNVRSPSALSYVTLTRFPWLD
jgi:Tol biopolymer transport system component